MFYAAAAFYPFDFRVPQSAQNPVDRLDGDAGLRFSGIAVASTDAPPSWVNEVIETGQFELDLQLVTTEPFQPHTSRIFTVSTSHSRRNLTVAQRGSNLVVLVRTLETDLNGDTGLLVADVFRELGASNIRIVADSGRLMVSVNGVVRAERELPPSPFRNWNRSYRLALGNELDPDREMFIRFFRYFEIPAESLMRDVVALDDRAWNGIIKQAKIRTGKSTVDYTSPGVLSPPTARWEFIEDPAFALFHWNTMDNVLNFAAFIPLGLLMCPRRPQRPLRLMPNLLTAVTTGLLISVGIEITQFFLQPRVSSVTDLLTNMSGSALGALVALSSAPKVKSTRT